VSGASADVTATRTGATLAGLVGAADPQDERLLAAQISALTARLGGPARIGLAAGTAVLDAGALALAGRRLCRLNDPARQHVLDALAARPAGGRLLDALKMPALLVAGAGRYAGEPASSSAPAGRPDAELDCTPAPDWPTCVTADAVVVGSGAGGAFAARTLARAGHAVVVVEEGRRHRVQEFRDRPPLDRFLELYRDGGATVALGRPPVLLPLGRGVGGTTLVNSGTCYRTPDPVLRHWREDRGVPLAEPDRFGALLDEVEATLRVAPQPLDVLGRNGLLALAGARRLGWRAEPLRRNAPGCGGCCQCAAGCPRNAKNGVHLNALPQACAAGARILSEARVVRVLVERGRAAGVVARRPDGSVLRILAPLVVVAAGATETPPLLRRSGLGGHPRLGRHLAVHPAVSVAGRFAEPVVAWSGVLQSVGIEELHDDGILIEATGSLPGMGTFLLPGTGSALRGELAGADHLATLGAMIADRPSGRVLGRRRAVIRYHLAPPDAARLRRAVLAMGRVLFAAGAVEVLTGISAYPRARSAAELAAIVDAAPAGGLHLSAFHPTGTARMGADPQRAPVDEQGRLRGVRGVLVADASVLPTCPRVNPQLTIMAMALGVAGAVSGPMVG
jgi:choline dehydrogenase-like flavoprotein